MKKFILMIPFIAGCPVAHTIASKELPMEEVKCTHPDSQFEAAVEVTVKDSVRWHNLEFHIYQEQNEWNSKLFNTKEAPLTWHTRMQLYELDCTDDYSYDVDYN